MHLKKLFAVGLATIAGVAIAADPGTFAKRVTYTVNETLAGASDLSGVPVLVKLATNSPAGFTYNDCPTADAIRFVDANGTVLPFEVDTWNPSGTSLLWVKVANVEQGAAFTMFYDGTPSVANTPSAVWSNYTGVWHLNTLTAATDDNAQGTYANSTAASGIDGHLSKMSIPNEPGRFGASFRVNDTTASKDGNFNEGGVYVKDAGTDSPVDGGANFTISGWFKHNDWNFFWDHMFYKRAASANTGSPNNAFAIEVNNASNKIANPMARGSSGAGTAVNLATDIVKNWVYVTFAYEGATCHVYENGKLTKSVTVTSCVDNDAPLTFGNNCNIANGATGDAAWSGWIDEVRFAKGTMTANQIAAEYAAMASDTFLNAGAVIDPAVPRMGSVSLGELTMTTATFTGTIEDLGTGATGCDVYVKLGASEGAGEAVRVLQNQGAGPFSFTVENLADGAIYFYEVTVVNSQSKSGVPAYGRFRTKTDRLLPVATAAETTALLQAAIDAAANEAEPGEVLLAAGTFELNAQLMVTGGVRVVGMGWDKTTLKLVPQTPGADTRCATVSGGSALVGLTLTGGHIRKQWESGAGAFVEDGTISWCCVSNNLLGDSSWKGVGCNNMTGGGIYIKKGTIDHTIIANNGSYAPGGGSSDGGGLGISGPVCVDSCLIYGNVTVGSGGGIKVASGSNIEIRNTTVVGNRAGAGKSGCGINFTTAKIINTIVTDNVAGEVESNVTGTFASGSSNNFIGGDPLFVDAANGDYHLDRHSECCAGGVTVAEGATDLDGVEYDAETPSIGCYQFVQGEVSVVYDPIFSPEAVSFYPTLAVTILCETEGATVHYTLDGNEPTEVSAVYTEPILLTETTTITVRGYKDGMEPSDIVAATYEYAEPIPPTVTDVAVKARDVSAQLTGTIGDVGNNGATACTIYLALGTDPEALGEPVAVVFDAATGFKYTLSGLETETTYYYAVTVENNAPTAVSTTVSGSFTTLAEDPGLEPIEGDAAATTELLQNALNEAVGEADPTVLLGEGTFEITAQLNIPEGVTLKGQGYDKTIIRQTTDGARCAVVNDGATLYGVTLTGGRIIERWSDAAGAHVVGGTISWCRITDNIAGTLGNNINGAGISIKAGTIDHTIIDHNQSLAGAGGASQGGGVGIVSPTGPILIDTCLIANNSADGTGGGIIADFGNNHQLLTIRNTTIIGNVAKTTGGGLHVAQYEYKQMFDLALINTLIADNVSKAEEADANISYSDRVNENVMAGYAAQSFNNLFANGTPALGTDAVSVAGSGAAWFMDAANGDYHLADGTLPVGMGFAYDGIAEALDLDGAKWRKSPAVGCYELGRKGFVIVVR